MQIRNKYLAIILAGAIGALVLFIASDFYASVRQTAPNVPGDIVASSHLPLELGRIAGTATATTEPEAELLMPMSGGLERVTKKPFGLKVSPNNSPVENDIFSGYHTGIDFEILPHEENAQVPIVAACDGNVVLKTWAKGYGGVLVQACQLDGEAVTVVYGHLKLESIAHTTGQLLQAGDYIGSLGQGLSPETDGRRKHLHFDIHKGPDLDIHGYVPSPEDLTGWLDPRKYLQ